MTKRAFALTSLAAALAWSFGGTADLAAQQECQLEPTDAVTRAQSLITEAREEESPDEARMKYEEAYRAVEGSLEARHAGALIMGATASIGLGRYESADELLDRFLELAPDCAEVAENTRYNAWVGLYNEAITAYEDGDTQTALDRFETANLIYEDPRSLNNAAFLHEQQGNTETAIELYRRTLQTGGDEEQLQSAMTSLASLLTAAGRTEEALELYAGHLEQNPDDVVVQIQYALLLTDLGDAEQAALIFEEVLAREGLSNEQWNQVGVGLFNAERYEQAAAAFRKAHDANPHNKEGLENLVTVLVQANKLAEAEESAQLLVDRYPYDEGNVQLLARTLAGTDRGQEALELMQRIDDAPMVFQSAQMAEAGEGRYIVRGILEGRESGAGTTMLVPVELLAADGSVIASQKMEITVPEAGETVPFEVTIETDQEAAGFQYRKAGSDGIQK